MKKAARTSFKIFVALILFSLMTIQISYTCSPAPTSYRPIYLSFEALRGGIQSLSPEPLRNPGKILVKGYLIFISERFKGVHVIDNSDPTVPSHVAFIKVPGNIDLAMKGNILYADSYVDLVALDVSNPKDVFATERLENIYPNEPFVEEETYWIEEIDTSKGLVVGRELVSSGGSSCGDGGGDSIFGCSQGGGGSGGGGSPAASPPSFDQSAGISGSLARITIVNDYFYSCRAQHLKLCRLSILPTRHTSTPSN